MKKKFLAVWQPDDNCFSGTYETLDDLTLNFSEGAEVYKVTYEKIGYLTVNIRLSKNKPKEDINE